jgi:hypothetical protein
MNILTVIPFHSGDLEQAARLADWIAELDHDTDYPSNILLAMDAGCPTDIPKAMASKLRGSGVKVHSMFVSVLKNDWPRNANSMFHHVAQYVKDTFRTPFFWMEPDCIPLKSGWAYALERAYEESPKRFMGAFVTTTDTGLPPTHMAGCAVYPNNAIDYLSKYCDDKATTAWDMGMANEMCVQQKAHPTELIQSYYGQRDLAPTFVVQKEPGKEYPINTFDLSQLKPSAVLFHRNKDATLINALKSKKNETVPAPTPKKNKPELVTT